MKISQNQTQQKKNIALEFHPFEIDSPCMSKEEFENHLAKLNFLDLEILTDNCSFILWFPNAQEAELFYFKYYDRIRIENQQFGNKPNVFKIITRYNGVTQFLSYFKHLLLHR